MPDKIPSSRGSPPSPSKGKKKKSPTKKLALKADYGGIVFGTETPAASSEPEPDAEDDPLASYRAAAAAAKAAAAKERKDEAHLALFKKIFATMDIDGDGRVAMADMVEKVAAGTAQLSHRAQASRPDGAVAMQLPMVFTLDEWIVEMRRMASQMDDATFQANVLGLFECFEGLEPTPRAAAAVEPLDRHALLRELFRTMDTDGDGAIDVDDFLAQARTSDEATELRSLFHFFDANFGAKDSQLGMDAFCEGTLTNTPVGRMRDSTFASAVRGMMVDVRRALAAKESAKRKLGLLKALLTTLEHASHACIPMHVPCILMCMACVWHVRRSSSRPSTRTTTACSTSASLWRRPSRRPRPRSCAPTLRASTPSRAPPTASSPSESLRRAR